MYEVLNITYYIDLRFLAIGNSYSDLAFTFRMHHSSISEVIPEVC